MGEGNDASFFFILLEIRRESCERESREYRNIMLPPAGAGDSKDSATVYNSC